MPASLFPTATRRHWIQQSLAAGMGSLWSWNGAEAARSDGEFWALLSDTHIAADEALEARGIAMSAQMKRVVSQVLGVGVKPHGVLIDGDCAFKDGQSEDYTQFLRCLGPLAEANVQVHCALGNHDDRANFRAANAQPGVESLMTDRHVTILSSAHVNWVVLDSLDEVDKTPGVLGTTQLGWLKRALNRLPDKPTLVMVHHNPIHGTPQDGKISGLTDTEDLLRVLKGNSRVKALFYGHVHNWNAQPPADGNPWLIGLPPVAYVFNPERPAGWVLARAFKDKLTLELRALNPGHAEHRQRVEIPFV